MSRQALDKKLRSDLEKTVVKAREIAELAATEVVQRLGIGESTAPTYLDDGEGQLRRQLRAHGRQLGDILRANDEQETRWLVREIAYSHWHQMLFARFLEQNHLLMYDANTPVTLEECVELAEEEGYSDAWVMASALAAKMLPQIFRLDSPVYGVSLPINHIRTLEELIGALAVETFQAQDALGWVYQFWQNKRKEEVNKSQVKIGARELSPVTQLFTEPYMVSFLLDNALGAWWANRRLTDNDKKTANTEAELRQRAAIEGVSLEYLRFVKAEVSDEEKSQGIEGEWIPAAGTFAQWPEHLGELKTLDPCCGSGHFLVATFLMLVPMRMVDEGLTAKDAVDLVLSQNIHGLELDQRCVELAAFALALEAWRFPDAGGYRVLPELHLACSGLSVKAAKEEWKALGLGKKNLIIALDWMHQTFEDAPVLGSLINPRKSNAAKIVQWEELEGALNQALTAEQDDENIEASIVAQGLAKAATLLAGQYSWVITNVPYLARGKQNEVLKKYIEKRHSEAKNDLATAFLDRCLELCAQGGSASVVLPQNWLFLTSYKKFREKLLNDDTWNLLVRIGEWGFESSAAAGAFVALISVSRGQSWAPLDQSHQHQLRGLDVSEVKSAQSKSDELVIREIKSVDQAKQLDNPDAKVILKSLDKQDGNLLDVHLVAPQGIITGDADQWRKTYWEVMPSCSGWIGFQSAPTETSHFFGKSYAVDWRTKGAAMVRPRPDCFAFNRKGVMIGQMRNLPGSLYSGDKFDGNVAPLIPTDSEELPAVWAFISSAEFRTSVRELDQKLNVTNGSFLQVSFDINYWSGVAQDKYPNGLPLPYSNDPTQWIYHGHPCGSVIWDEQKKWTVNGTLRKDENVLQVAVARLLGYQWPAELDPDMELAEEQRHWVNACAALIEFVDDDGIACLPAIRGEKSAADRLEALLQAAFGEAWNANVLNELLASVKAKSLDRWLRDKFFEQHCKLFQHRPFIWQIWDGQPDGFSALVNYHQFDHANLQRLIYTYLNDWIRLQEDGVKNAVDGADIRFNAANNLKDKLEAIQAGEKGLGIFVRWKPLAEQPMGWNPDLNDGVRLNIRPFLKVGDVAKKDAGILRGKPNIHWKKDRGTDVESAPWFTLGPDKFDEKPGSRINDHYLTLAEKQAARDKS